MRITVFTPTYNRAYIIENLYHSLKNQTFKDFEWLVIDDGSTDETNKLFDRWLSENNDFVIRYYYYENVGKQKEINRALDLVSGDLFFTVDSDDLLTPDALEKIDTWEKILPPNEKFCGFAGSGGNMDGHPMNPIFDEPYIDVTFLNRYAESGLFIGHDRPWVFYTKVHKLFKYPEFEGEKFISEAVVWNRMAAAGYKIRCFNDVIYLWEHQIDGITNGIQKTLSNNPQGFGLWRKELMDILHYDFFSKLKNYYSFYCDVNKSCKTSEIAKYIGAPVWFMYMAKLVFWLKHR